MAVPKRKVSPSRRNKRRAHDALGTNAYVVKPVEFRRFANILQQLELFWLGINHPPPGAHHVFAPDAA